MKRPSTICRHRSTIRAAARTGADHKEQRQIGGAWGWRGLTSYFAGFIAEIPFMVLPPIAGLSYTGWIRNHVTHGVDYSWLVGLVVSGLVYFVLSRSLDLAAERSAIEASERELQAIDVAAEAAALAEQAHPDAREAAPAAEPGPVIAQAPEDDE